MKRGKPRITGIAYVDLKYLTQKFSAKMITLTIHHCQDKNTYTVVFNVKMVEICSLQVLQMEVCRGFSVIASLALVVHAVNKVNNCAFVLNLLFNMPLYLSPLNFKTTSIYISTFSPIETMYCGGLLRNYDGVITSPGFPNEPYPDNTECVWRITTDPGKRIAVGVVANLFDVEKGTSLNSCDNDWVSVHDGINTSANQIGPFCGNTSRSFQTIHSTGRHLYIKFHSNNSTHEGTGQFLLEYTTYREGISVMFCVLYL